jgi:hypothetical protein
MKGKLLMGFLILCSVLHAQGRRWSVHISVSRSIVAHATKSQKQQCENSQSDGEEETRLQVNVMSDSLVEEISPGEVQVTSDLPGRKITGSGTFTNSGKTSLENNCSCDGCGDCRQTSTRNVFNGSGSLDLSKVTFSFSYDIEKKQGTLYFSCGFNKKGNASTTTKDCNETKTISKDLVYETEQNVAELGYGQITVQNFDLYKEAGLDAATVAKINEANKSTGIGGLATIIPVNGGYELSYSYTTTVTAPAQSSVTGDQDTQVSGSSEQTITTTVHASFMPHSKFKAFIEPTEGWASYKKWLPEGNIIDEMREPGSTTSFYIRIVDTDHPDKKINPGVKEIVYELKDVSHIPGICMNHPYKDQDTKADISLYDITAVGSAAKNTELSTLKVKDIAMGAVIQSFDFGGYAKLTAKVTLTTGEVLTAESSDDHKAYVNIPYRKDDSFVATYWKEQNKAGNSTDDEDKDESPLGVGEKYPGDGYTLFEEYRGFREDLKHIRTNPVQKDLMILNLVDKKARAQNGINLFAGATGIITHSKFREEEFGRDQAEPGLNDSAAHYGAKGIDHDKVLNFNFEPSLHLVDQHGLLMLSSPRDLGFAFALPKPGRFPAPPGGCYFLVITHDFDPSAEGYSTTRGNLDSAGKISTNPNGKAKIITDEYAVTVAHEMLHYCHVDHHGETDDKKITVLSDGTSVKAKKGNTEFPITLRWNDKAGTEIKPLDGNFWNRHIGGLVLSSVGVVGGQHSGVEDCIMRYDVAQAFYSKDKKTIYLLIDPNTKDLPAGQHLYHELTGINLCDKKEGTGVNASDAVPRSRYGDASSGNCKAQVCISDKY